MIHSSNDLSICVLHECCFLQSDYIFPFFIQCRTLENRKELIRYEFMQSIGLVLKNGRMCVADRRPDRAEVFQHQKRLMGE